MERLSAHLDVSQIQSARAQSSEVPRAHIIIESVMLSIVRLKFIFFPQQCIMTMWNNVKTM